MNLLKEMKRNKQLRYIYGQVRELVFEAATVISPELNTKMRYKAAFGRPLDLDNPKTLNEKLLWLKLNRYMNDPLVIQCADKYRVREYVEQCGCEDILNELIGVYDRAEDIPWDELPNQFVLKWNFGAGMNIICTDKSEMNRKEVINQMKKWGKKKYWLSHSEMQYKYMKKKIICEKLLADNSGGGGIPDYKVYCFNGHPKAIFVMHDRETEIKSEFFDCDWNALNNTYKYRKPHHETDRPACLNFMIGTSEKLAAPFPFVRCDYYIVNGKLYFGELTFTPAGGLCLSQTEIDGKDMGALLSLT